MTPQALLNAIDAGLLDSYAQLSEDCPAGITAHVWRSYGLIVFMQLKYKRMIDAKELAERAGLTDIDPLTGKLVTSVATAERHLRLLQALGLLEVMHDDGKAWSGQWRHQGLPKAWQKLG